MEAFLLSTGIVALAEIGDKTQLLAFVLAARFRKPLLIIIGILFATVLNHAIAGALGAWLAALMTPELMRWILGVSFVAMAGWMLIPDRLGEDEVHLSHLGVFGTTFIAFFVAEMGDKAQIATMALAAKYQAFYGVVLGTTLGMMIANVPVILLGNRIVAGFSIRLINAVAAAVFALLGCATLLGAGERFGL